jgi:hypothetical protein
MKYLSKTLALVTAAAIGLSACGGGGGGSAVNASSPAVLSGTAAVGTPIVGAVVSVSCANGLTATSQPTSSTGAWQVAVNTQAFPCAVQLNGGTINGLQNLLQLHSIGLAAGTLNVTPLTDLMVGLATHSPVPSGWFSAVRPANLSAVDVAALQNAFSLIVTLLNINQLGTTVNPMTTAFTPVAGNVMDDTLAALTATLNSVNVTYSALLLNIGSQTPSVPAGFAAALLSQYAIISTGSIPAPVVPTPTGTNTTTGLASNGAPQVAPANCAMGGGIGGSLKCQANAIANFGPANVQDATTGQVCTASYVNGTLSVSNGIQAVTGYLNGQVMSQLSVYGTINAMTPQSLGAWASGNGQIAIAKVNWNAAGIVTSIYGQTQSFANGTPSFTCTN